MSAFYEPRVPKPAPCAAARAANLDRPAGRFVPQGLPVVPVEMTIPAGMTHADWRRMPR